MSEGLERPAQLRIDKSIRLRELSDLTCHRPLDAEVASTPRDAFTEADASGRNSADDLLAGRGHRCEVIVDAQRRCEDPVAGAITIVWIAKATVMTSASHHDDWANDATLP